MTKDKERQQSARTLSDDKPLQRMSGPYYQPVEVEGFGGMRIRRLEPEQIISLVRKLKANKLTAESLADTSRQTSDHENDIRIKLVRQSIVLADRNLLAFPGGRGYILLSAMPSVADVARQVLKFNGLLTSTPGDAN